MAYRHFIMEQHLFQKIDEHRRPHATFRTLLKMLGSDFHLQGVLGTVDMTR
jgi:hypothetical protein